MDRSDAARALVASLRSRIERVRAAVDGLVRPRVACIEWVDPPFNGGHWVPEQVHLAGGQDVLGTPGKRSRELDWKDVRAAWPDVVVVMPCGWDARRAEREAGAIPDLGARVVAVDGNAYFSRPGPRLVDGVALLASILHPRAVPVPGGALAIEVRTNAYRGERRLLTRC